MKFATRFVLLIMLVLALSVAVVGADEDMTGVFVQGATTFMLEDMGDDIFTLTLYGVAGTTPLIFGDFTGGFATAELLTDWLATGVAVPLELRFQYGNPADTLYDYTVSANAIPAGEFVDGSLSYALSDVNVTFVEIAGTAPDAASVVTGEKPDLATLIQDGDYINLLTYVAVYISIDLTFIDALAIARVDRLNDARPSSIGGSCIPKVTCLPK